MLLLLKSKKLIKNSLINGTQTGIKLTEERLKLDSTKYQRLMMSSLIGIEEPIMMK